MSTDSTLGRIVRDAMDLWEELKARGVSLADRLAGMEGVIRQRWPFAREWKYICEDCGDTGWAHGRCTPATPCGRAFSLPKQRHDDYTGRGQCTPGHTYVQACFCPRGRAFEAALFASNGASNPEDFAAAGRTRKMTKLGR